MIFGQKISKYFLSGTKIQLQLSKSGVFWLKKYSTNFLKLGSYVIHGKTIHNILPKIFRNFLRAKKSRSILVKKIFRKFLETSGIISLYEGYSRYFCIKFQKHFQVDKSPTKTFKMGFFLVKKIFRRKGTHNA